MKIIKKIKNFFLNVDPYTKPGEPLQSKETVEAKPVIEKILGRPFDKEKESLWSGAASPGLPKVETFENGSVAFWASTEVIDQFLKKVSELLEIEKVDYYIDEDTWESGTLSSKAQTHYITRITAKNKEYYLGDDEGHLIIDFEMIEDLKKCLG